MKYRLQGYVAAFGSMVANAFDLDVWRQATALTYFGVGLRVRSGSMRVALMHIAPDGATTRAALLDCPEPGAAFSPPFHLPDLSGMLLPVIEAHSEGVEYDLYFGTDSAPATPWLRVGYICSASGDGAAARCAASFGHYQRIYGDGPAAHLAVIDGSGAADIAPGPHVSVLANDATGLDGTGRGLYEACYGSLSSLNFTHLALIGEDLRLDPELFARLTALLRFLRPGFRIGAPLYRPAAEDPARPGAGLRFGWRVGDRIETGDQPLETEASSADPAAILAAPRDPDIPGAWLNALEAGEIYRTGLPSALLGGEAAAEHALRLRAAGMRLVVPLSIWALRGPDGEEAGEGTGDAAPPRRRALRDRMLRLALTGPAETPEGLRDRIGPPVRTALDAGDFPHAADLLGALNDLLLGDEPPRQAGTPPHPQSARSLLELRLRGALGRVGRDWPGRLASYRALRERTSTIGYWGQAAGNRPPADPAGDLPDLRQSLTALQQELAAAYARMEALRGELQRARQDDSDRIAGLLRRNRLENTPQVLGDLNRASIAALHLLRNRHAGRRAFVVGNGPSLQIGDINRLRNEITFASNKIYLAFEETDWRPVYYSVEDSLVMQQNHDRIAALKGVTKIFPDNMRLFGYQREDAIFIPFLPPASFDDPLSDPEFPDFSEDLCHGICWGSSIVYSQIQMALFMGCSEIILIGIDHDYQLPKTRKGRFYVHEDERNHFHPDYRSPGETWHQPNLDVLEVSFARARERCADRDVQVLNASRRTRLTVFERVDFDSLFDEPQRESDDDHHV